MFELRATSVVSALLAIALAVALGAYSYQAKLSLDDPTFVSGYILFALMIGLYLLRVRKRLSMVPLFRARSWLTLHVVGGVLALAVFWLHTGMFWPHGFYEQILAGLFYLVTVSGVVGYFIQKIYPRRMTQTGREIIYERIPGAIAELRAAAESLVLECTRKTSSDTLGRYYTETFEWFLQRPRFFASHAFGGGRGEQWRRHHRDTVRRYLSEPELPYLEKLSEILAAKGVLDVHYAGQRMMKIWLWFHVPIATALMVFVIWHFLLVNIYAS